MINSQDVFFMDLAIKEAKKNLRISAKPFGAVITRKGKVISKSCSLSDKLQDPTAHAEIEAIRQASKTLKSKYLPDCVLYTTCEPCVMCLGAALWAKIPKLVIGVSRRNIPPKVHDFIYRDSKSWAEKHSLENYPVSIKDGVLEKECLKLFEQYIKKIS